MTTQKINPLLEKLQKLPGQTFRLPSRGKLYKKNEIDPEVIDGEVLVFPMTGLDEIYMKSPDMLFQGTSIDFVIKRCVPQILEPLALYANDIDYILTCLRVVSYGPTIPIKQKCEECEGEREEFLIPIANFLRNSKELNESDIKDFEFKTSNGFNVILKPRTMEDMLKLYNIDDSKFKTPEEYKNAIDTAIITAIRSVDECEDLIFIEEWLNKIPREVLKEISNKIEQMSNWGLSFKHSVTCSHCNHESTINTVLNPIHFFI